MDIGIVGAGNIGGTLGRHLVRAGHRVLLGVRNPDATATLVAELGEAASAGSPADAAAFGSALIFAGPFGAWPVFADENQAALAGKLVIDASNPYPARDGAIAREVVSSHVGSGAWLAELLPGSFVVKAFNSAYWIDLRDQAGRAGERLAMPMAGEDDGALRQVGELAEAVGFDPVTVG